MRTPSYFVNIPPLAWADNNRICIEEVPKLVCPFGICKPVTCYSFDFTFNPCVLSKSGCGIFVYMQHVRPKHKTMHVIIPHVKPRTETILCMIETRAKSLSPDWRHFDLSDKLRSMNEWRMAGGSSFAQSKAFIFLLVITFLPWSKTWKEQRSHYILRLTIAPMRWNHVRQEKKKRLFSFYFILFSPPTCHKCSLQSHSF